jgi:hypothetical protein
MQNLTFHQSIPFVELTQEIALSPLDYYCECDNYILVYPYAHLSAPLEALQYKSGTFSIIIDRDEYQTKDIELVYRICEIYYDTESVIDVRDYLTKTIDK